MEHATFVGIDVSKDHLDVHIRPTDEAFRVSYDDAGLAILLARLRALSPTLIVFEATGGYEVPLAATLGQCRAARGHRQSPADSPLTLVHARTPAAPQDTVRV